MDTSSANPAFSWKTARRYLFAVFAAGHLFCLLYNNVIIEEQTFKEFFLNIKEPGVAYTLVQEAGLFGKFFTMYSEFSGAETGYGFYAPNVSSQIVVVFTVKDTLGNIVNITLPNFNSNETQLRYFTAFDTFLDKLETDNERYNKFVDVILKSMAFRVLRDHWPHRDIEADIYVYDLPYMPDYRKGARPRYSPLMHTTYRMRN